MSGDVEVEGLDAPTKPAIGKPLRSLRKGWVYGAAAPEAERMSKMEPLWSTSKAAKLLGIPTWRFRELAERQS